MLGSGSSPRREEEEHPAAAVVSLWSPSQGRNEQSSLSATQTLRLGCGCPLLPLLFRSIQPGLGWQAVHDATGRWENNVQSLPRLSLCLWVSDTPSPAAVGAVVTLSSKNLAGEAGNLVVGMAAGVFSSFAAWLVWVKDMGDTAHLELGRVCGGTLSQAAGSTPRVCNLKREATSTKKKGAIGAEKQLQSFLRWGQQCRAVSRTSVSMLLPGLCPFIVCWGRTWCPHRVMPGAALTRSG